MGPWILSRKRQGRKECLSLLLSACKCPGSCASVRLGPGRRENLSLWVEPWVYPRPGASSGKNDHASCLGLAAFPTFSENIRDERLRVSWPGVPATEKLLNLPSFPGRKARGGGGKVATIPAAPPWPRRRTVWLEKTYFMEKIIQYLHCRRRGSWSPRL